MKTSISKNSAPLVDIIASRNFSPFERLPTEILEIIFFNCLNLNLPRVSPILGIALSSFYVKARLFEMVFAFDSEQYELSYAQQLEDIFCLSGDWKDEVGCLQSELLKKRWVKADFFRRYIPIFLERAIRAFCKDQILPIYVYKPVFVTTEYPVQKGLAERRACPITPPIDRRGVLARLCRKQIRLIDVTVLFEDHMAVQIQLADHPQQVHDLLDSNGSLLLKDDDDSLDYYERIYGYPKSRTMLRCLWGCYIPAKFLRGPWTKDQCHIMAMLSEAGAKVNIEDPTDREIALQAFFHALKNQNLKIIRHLLRSLLPGPEYLVYAVIYLDCPKIIVESMIRRHQRYWRSIHWHTLRDWAEQKAAEGNSRGWWLLDTLRRFPAHGLKEGEVWAYVPPEDPNFSPGSLELILWL